jgi:Ca2+/Na+ antiporter
MLLLVPAFKYVVGSVVLPVLGAVPDGAIIAFSGAGKHPQHEVAVGVGALAGSTIMLLTMPWFLAILGGRVSIYDGKPRYGYPYSKLIEKLSSGGGDVHPHSGVDEADIMRGYEAMKAAGLGDMLQESDSEDPVKRAERLLQALTFHRKNFSKLLPERSGLWTSGVEVSRDVRTNAIIMVCTSVGLLVIQIPALSMEQESLRRSAKGESIFALAGMLACFVAFFLYLYWQFRNSDAIRAKVYKKKMQAILDGDVSLSGAFFELVQIYDEAQKHVQDRTNNGAGGSGGAGGSCCSTIESLFGACGLMAPERRSSRELKKEMKQLLKPLFAQFDKDGSGWLEQTETATLIGALGEDPSHVSDFLKEFDLNDDGRLSFDEFTDAMFDYIRRRAVARQAAEGAIENDAQMLTDAVATPTKAVDAKRLRTDLKKAKGARFESLDFETKNGSGTEDGAGGAEEEDSEEESDEEMPEDLLKLSDDEKQAELKSRSYRMMFSGILLVMIFSDPMVDVFGEIGARAGVSPFFVSFVLAPMVSNASELIASYNYASKRTRLTMSSALSALEGAGSMNNTFCTGIFLFLIYSRGLAWRFTAETAAIIAVELLVAAQVLTRTYITLFDACVTLSFYPLSLVLIKSLHYIDG